VLSAELELAHLDARHWRNGWRLLVPPRVLAPAAWALIVVDGSLAKPVRAVVAGAGARPVTPEATAAGYAAQLKCAAAIVLDAGVIAALSAEIEALLRPDMEGPAQALIALKAMKRHAGHGIWSEPPLLELLPAPGHDGLQRTFDLLVPDRTAMLAYVIEDDRSRVHTSIIATKQHGDVTRAAQHRAIADLVPEASFARDWAAQHGRVLAAVEERFAKPSVGLFLERATLMRILTGPSDQLARELDAKHLIIDPAPAWLLGLLGGAAVVAMAGRAASALAHMMPKSARDRASSLAHRAQAVMKESGAHPFALLGFDPLELFHQLKHHYRP
jgi:hypothetical protein